jgi:hypothetical protein
MTKTNECEYCWFNYDSEVARSACATCPTAQEEFTAYIRAVEEGMPNMGFMPDPEG